MSEEQLQPAQGEVVIYQSENGDTKIDVRFVDETVWLTQAQMAELFQASKANISEHIKNIFDEGELNEEATVRKFRTVQTEGNRTVSRNLTYLASSLCFSSWIILSALPVMQSRIVSIYPVSSL